jgi:hypothetical protein
VQITGSGLEVNDFIKEAGAIARVLEVVRSGSVTIEPGHAVLGAQVERAA